MHAAKAEISDRSLAPVARRQAMLEAMWSPWTPRTLDGALARAAAIWPSRPYLITDARTWSYQEMDGWVDRLAAGLAAAGVRPGEHVALVVANHPEFVALKYGISRAGAVAVPINVLNRRDELAYVVAQSDAAVLVVMDGFRDLDHPAMLDELMPGWETGGGGAAFPRLRKVVVLQTGVAPLRPAALPFSALEAEPQSRFSPGDPQAVADIIYTSGTTGAPKGVQLTHDMLLRTAYAAGLSRAFEDGRRILFALPMYHVFGYVEGMLPALFAGGAIVPRLRFDAHDMLAAAERHGATDLLSIPTMTLALLDAAVERPYALSLRTVLASGGWAPERLWTAIGEVLSISEITTGYGMTEVTASATVTRPDDPISRLLTTNGRMREAGAAGDPARGGRLVEYRIVDPTTGRPLPAGEVGEIMAQGPGVTRGYYNKPDATAAAFDAEGWLHTGDLGRIDAEGYVTLVGRLKESYRCGGELVLPSEVESVLTSHPDVEQAHVVPTPDPRMGEVGVAFVVLRAGARTTATELQARVARRVARFKVPARLAVVKTADIPVTASGRARKFLLAERAAALLATPA